MTEQTDTKNIEKPLSKEEHIRNYIKLIMTIDYQIEPLRESKKDTKKSYKDNGWLDADDFKKITKVMSLLKAGIELQELEEVIKPVTEGFNAPIGREKREE